MKKILTLLILFSLLPLGVAWRSGNPRIYIEPDTMTVVSGTNVSFEIRVSDVTDLYGVAFDISMPLNELSVKQSGIEKSTDKEKNFLERDKRSIVVLSRVKKNENRIIVGISRIGQVEGVSGSGLLLKVNFVGGNTGIYDVKLQNITLFDSKMRQMNIDTQATTLRVTVVPQDKNPPTVEFTTTPPPETNKTLSIQFEWEGSDDKTLPENLLYSYKLDEEEWSEWKHTTSYVTPNLKEGSHTFSVKAKDEAGNESEVLIYTFIVDITPPELEVTSPQDGTQAKDKLIDITGKTEPNIKVDVNGIIVNSDSQGNFTASYSLNEGDNLLTIKAIDKAGNETVKKIHVIYKPRTIIRLQIGNLMAVVNDETVMLDLAPFIENGRTLVPLRFVAETFGAEVGWDPVEERITITLGDKVVVLWIGKKEALIDGERYYLDVPPKVIEIPEIGGGRTVVPLRFVSEAFGAKVEWDPELQIITITYPGD